MLHCPVLKLLWILKSHQYDLRSIRMLEINEGSTCLVTLDFKDENGVAVTPASGRYRIDDAESGTTVLHWTAFTPASSQQKIYVAANDNRLISQEHIRETRIVTVEFTYGGGYIGTGETRYTVLGLKHY